MVENEFKDIFGDWEPGGERKPSDNDTPEELERMFPPDLEEKEIKIVGVYEHTAIGDSSAAQTFVLVQDPAGRKVFIFIGRNEAYSISLAMEGEMPERPMTHDLTNILIERLGAHVEKVIIDDIWHDTFYAKITLKQGDKYFQVDCRPSDAIALAIRAHAPIYMAEQLLETCQQEI
jgi:bifunctional DNase/RNase